MQNSDALAYGLTTKVLLLVSVPFVVVTVIGPVVAPAGITTFMKVFSTSLTSVAATLLNNLSPLCNSLKQPQS